MFWRYWRERWQCFQAMQLAQEAMRDGIQTIEDLNRALEQERTLSQNALRVAIALADLMTDDLPENQAQELLDLRQAMADLVAVRSEWQ